MASNPVVTRRGLLASLLLAGAVAGLIGSLSAHAAKPTAAKKSDFGAVAYNPRTGAWGVSYDQKSSRDALAVAMRECGAGCGETRTFRNACGAVAASREHPPTRHALMTGKNRELAEAAAVKKCGRGCVALAWACTK